jgi:hypothetical protein
VSAADPKSPEPRADALDGCFRTIPAVHRYQELQMKESADREIRVRILLESFGREAPRTNSFRLLRFGLQRGSDSPVCVSEKALLTYKVTHQNHADVASATAGGTTYVVNLQLNATPMISRTEDVQAASGKKRLWGPVQLLDVACNSRTSTLNDQECVQGKDTPTTPRAPLPPFPKDYSDVRIPECCAEPEYRND